MNGWTGKEVPVEVAPGVLRTEHAWADMRFYMLRGTRDALLSAGLGQASWLHDGTKRDKRGHMKRTLDVAVNGREIRTYLIDHERQEFWVHFYETDAERMARKIRQGMEVLDPEQKVWRRETPTWLH